jgi:antitoxin component YwqK of YwqJK toxin-antitoxin module
MAQQARLRNKLFIAAVLLTFLSCTQQAGRGSIQQQYANADDVNWKEEGPLLYHDTILFSGSKFKLYPNGDTAFLLSYLNGKQEGEQRQWYPGKKLKELRNFVNGWQEAEQQGWHLNGRPAFVYHFKNDVYSGSVKQWYEDGRLFRDCNYAIGQEAGKQLFLNTDGSIKANYEVRNGRIYGNTGSKNCASPWKDN